MNFPHAKELIAAEIEQQEWTSTYLNVVRRVNVHVGEDHGQLSTFGMPDLEGTLLVVGVVGVAEGGGGQGAVVAVQDGVATYKSKNGLLYKVWNLVAIELFPKDNT